MKAEVALRILGHLMRAATVSELPRTPEMMMRIVTIEAKMRVP